MQIANVEHIKEEKKIPNLRFPGFKGEWEKSILKKEAYVNPKSPPLPEGFIYIDLESVNDGILTKEELIKIDNAPSRAQRLLAKEDILFQTVRPYQRNNLFFNKEGDYVASTGYAQIKAKANPKYLYQFLHTAPFVNKVIRWSTGTSYPAISPSDLVKIPIAFPSLPEQQKIASFLSAVDQKIQQLTRKKELLELYKKGVMQKIFSQEIRFKDENGNDYSDWAKLRLSDLLCESKTRNYDLNFGKNDVLSVSGNYGIVNQIEFQGRSFAGESVANYHVVETGDIVYTKSPLKANPYGIIKVNKGKPGIVSTLYAVYKCKETASDVYLDYYFQLDDNVNRYLRPLVHKGAKNDMKINNSRVLIDTIWTPERDEQNRIVEFLQQLDKKIEKATNQLAQTQKFKKGLLQQMFV